MDIYEEFKKLLNDSVASGISVSAFDRSSFKDDSIDEDIYCSHCKQVTKTVKGKCIKCGKDKETIEILYDGSR
ncbi:MAG: hypothetical protein MJZ41_11665 [Bacteroidaceae bacterium]|nr:hypothetical protein [Bacteroidaceae bacterium]